MKLKLELIDKLCKEHDFITLNINDFSIANDLTLNFSLCTQNHFEYFIFMEIPYHQLDLINDTIQISLFTKLKSYVNEIVSNEAEFKLTHFFDNNTTMIISTETSEAKNNEDIFKIVSSIEEDSFYFKKQILYYSNNEWNNLSERLVSDGRRSELLNSIITDPSINEIHACRLDSQFDFVTRIYAKLPFLSLIVEQQKLLNLDEMINQSLTKEESELVDETLNLDEDKIDEWIDKLGVGDD